MTMRREVCYVAALGIGAGAAMVLLTGSVHAAISYGVALMAAAFYGLGLARR